MGAVGSPETSLNFYRTTRRYIPIDMFVKKVLNFKLFTAVTVKIVFWGVKLCTGRYSYLTGVRSNLKEETVGSC
jgi:hypothetical protein